MGKLYSRDVLEPAVKLASVFTLMNPPADADVCHLLVQDSLTDLTSHQLTVEEQVKVH